MIQLRRNANENTGQTRRDTMENARTFNYLTDVTKGIEILHTMSTGDDGVYYSVSLWI